MIKKVVNQVDNFPSGTSGSITIPATTAGNVLIILAVTSAGNGAKWTTPFVNTTDGNFTEVPFYTLQGGSLWDWGSFAGSSTSSDVLYQVTSGGVTVINWAANLKPDMIAVREISGLTTPVVIDDFQLTGSASGLVIGSALAASVNDLCYENFATFNYNLVGTLPSSPWLIEFGLADNRGSGALWQLYANGPQPAPAGVDKTGAAVTDQFTCASVAFKGVGPSPTSTYDANGNPVTFKYAFGDNFNLIAGRFVDTNLKIHSFPHLYSNDYTGQFDQFGSNSLPTGGGLGCPWGFSSFDGRYMFIADQCGAGGGPNGATLWQVDLATGTVVRLAGDGTGSGYPNEIALNWAFGVSLYTVKAGLDRNLYLCVPGFNALCMNMQSTPIVRGGVTIQPGFIAEVAGSVNRVTKPFQTDYSTAADAAGNVYNGDEGNNTGAGNTVYMTDVTGAYTRITGNGTAANTGDGGPASAALIDAPLSLSIDQNNILYIACTGNNGGSAGAVRAVNLSGTTQNVCGKTIAPGNIDTLVTIAGASSLWGVTSDFAGGVYVCDIQRAGACNPVATPGSRGWLFFIDPTGTYSQVAGDITLPGECGYSGDGGPALGAFIGSNYGVAIPFPTAAFCGGMPTQAVGDPLIG